MSNQLGIIEFNGKQYLERQLVIPEQVSITSNGQIYQGRITLTGVAMFLLKGLTREVLASNAPVTNRRFKFKFSNSDGGIQYTAGGVGTTNDRVLDSLIFGTGQFPFPIVPWILFSKSGSFLYEVEDVSSNVPYTIHMALHGSYLIPLSE